MRKPASHAQAAQQLEHVVTIHSPKNQSLTPSTEVLNQTLPTVADTEQASDSQVESLAEHADDGVDELQTESLANDSENDASIDEFAVWEQEKLEFYRNDLNLSEAEIDAVQNVSKDMDTELTELIKTYNYFVHTENKNIQLPPDFVRGGTDDIVSRYNAKIYGILGKTRFDATIAFRRQFNQDLHDRSGSNFEVLRF